MTNLPWSHPLMKGLPMLGADIEKRSHEIIDETLKLQFKNEKDKNEHSIARRMIHATGDLSLISTIKIHPEALENGISALKNGAPIFCDVQMLKAGMTHTPNPVHCSISDSEVIALSKELGITRAWAQMKLWEKDLSDSIVVIGNAPTAIWALLEAHELRGIKPALVIGTPVGFVGASESKEALYQSQLCYITNLGSKGGSPMAASAFNALAILARKHA